MAGSASLLHTVIRQENYLKDVVDLAIHEDTDMAIVSQDQQFLPSHKSLVSLFSPVISHLLSSVPSCASPTIFLPDFPSSQIRGLLEILQYGKTLPSQHLDIELQSIHDIANALQISFKDLALVEVNQDNEYIEKDESDEIMKQESIEDMDEELSDKSNLQIQEGSGMLSANINRGKIQVRGDLFKTESGPVIQNNDQGKGELNYPDIREKMVKGKEAKMRKPEYFEGDGSDNSIKLENFNIDYSMIKKLLNDKKMNKIDGESENVSKKRKVWESNRNVKADITDNVATFNSKGKIDSFTQERQMKNQSNDLKSVNTSTNETMNSKEYLSNKNSEFGNNGSKNKLRDDLNIFNSTPGWCELCNVRANFLHFQGKKHQKRLVNMSVIKHVCSKCGNQYASMSELIVHKSLFHGTDYRDNRK